MGADGGTIPTRCELVQTRKKPEQKDKDSVRIYKWQYCNLTQQPLVRPIVACELGRLYNKEAIIEKLLEDKAGDQQNGDKIIPEASADHIKSLKDVKELNLAHNPAYDRKSKGGPSIGGEGFIDRQVSPYICPVTGLEMNGRFKFVFDWSNGKVLSERALKMVNNDKTIQISEENLIVLNTEEKSEEAELMVTKMEARRARARAIKKAAKESKRKHEKSDGEVKVRSQLNGVQTQSNISRSLSSNQIDCSNQAFRESNSKKAKLSNNSQNLSGFNKVTSNDKTKSKHDKPGSKGSVQHDATKSEVYKSLFSSHKSAEGKPKGHWVTFDPRYN